MNDRYGNNKKPDNEGFDIEQNLIPILLVFAGILYIYIGIHSDKNDVTMLSFFSYLINTISGFIFFLLSVVIACLNAFALFVFVQTNSETKYDLTNEDIRNAALIIAALSMLIWGCYCAFPLCFIFMVYYVREGYILYNKYGEIPTKYQLDTDNGEYKSNNLNNETEEDDRIIDYNDFSRFNNQKSPKFKFDKIKDKKKQTNIDNNYKKDSDQISGFSYSRTKDLTFKDSRNNNNKAKKDSVSSKEKLPRTDNIKNIKSGLIDNTIDEVKKIKESIKEEKVNYLDVNRAETKVYSESNKLDKSYNLAENKPVVEINKNSDSLKNEEINKVTKIKSVDINTNSAKINKVDINTNSAEINKVDIGLYKPEISKVEISINKPQISSISSSIDIKPSMTNNNTIISAKPSDKKSEKKSEKKSDQKKSTKAVKIVEKQKIDSSTTSNSYTMQSLLGSIDISKSMLGSTSLASSIEVKPLILDTNKVDLPADKK